MKQPTNTTACNLSCSQTVICLPCLNLRVNVMSQSVLSGLVHSVLIIMHEGFVRWEQDRAFALISQDQR